MWFRMSARNGIHTIPQNDLIMHESKKCVCRPDVEGYVEDGSVQWHYIHHSLRREDEERE